MLGFVVTCAIVTRRKVASRGGGGAEGKQTEEKTFHAKPPGREEDKTQIDADGRGWGWREGGAIREGAGAECACAGVFAVSS